MDNMQRAEALMLAVKKGGSFYDNQTAIATALQAAKEAGAAEEREACAVLAEQTPYANLISTSAKDISLTFEVGARAQSRVVAAAIRARKEHP